MELKKVLSPSNIEKFAHNDPEQMLINYMYNKFGQRFLDYRNRYNENIQKKSDQTVYDYPNTVVLELVNRCNLQCTMCYQGFRNDAKKFTLDDNILDKIFKDFKLNQLNSLMLSISEPLLYKNIDKILQRAEEANIMDVFLFTNGILLNEKNSKIILNSNVTRLFISIDAVSEDTYNKVRIPVSKRLSESNTRLEELEKNIKQFIEMRNSLGKKLPLVRVSFVSLNNNKHEIENFKNKWSSIVESIEVQKEVSIKAYEELNNKSKKVLSNKSYFCREPWGQVTVYSDGTVAPCCNTFGRNLPVGDINKESIKDIWNGKNLKKIREELKLNKPNDVCATCINNTSETI